MNNILMDQTASEVNADLAYRLAEQKASQYFTTLSKQIDKQHTYRCTSRRFQHMAEKPHSSVWLAVMARWQKKTGFQGYAQYMHWMNMTGKLDDYLDRSISYIYMRDLGQALDTPKTIDSVRRIVEDTKKYFTRAAGEDQRQPDYISPAALYRWGRREQIEEAVIWVMHKLKQTAKKPS